MTSVRNPESRIQNPECKVCQMTLLASAVNSFHPFWPLHSSLVIRHSSLVISPYCACSRHERTLTRSAIEAGKSVALPEVAGAGCRLRHHSGGAGCLLEAHDGRREGTFHRAVLGAPGSRSGDNRERVQRRALPAHPVRERT